MRPDRLKWPADAVAVAPFWFALHCICAATVGPRGVAGVCRPALMHLNPLTYLACVGKAANCNVVHRRDAQIHCDANHGFSASKDLIFASVCS
jgi:hypothetical protein